jgi:hypothetical protein
MVYQERTYRNRVLNNNLVPFHVCIRETDLFILSDSDLSVAAIKSIHNHRGFIETYIKIHPNFLTSLVPIIKDNLAPNIVRDMLNASLATGVGPMASVAGAIAEYVGNDLLKSSRNVIDEKGGDIFLKTDRDIKVGIFAGDSPLTYKINLLIKSEKMPLGVCTSSGTVGHSLSFGNADAVCVTSKSSSMADAAATAIGNIVKSRKDIKTALDRGINIKGVSGIIIIVGDTFGAIGDIELS